MCITRAAFNQISSAQGEKDLTAFIHCRAAFYGARFLLCALVKRVQCVCAVHLDAKCDTRNARSLIPLVTAIFIYLFTGLASAVELNIRPPTCVHF